MFITSGDIGWSIHANIHSNTPDRRVDIPPRPPPKKKWHKVYNSFPSYWAYSEWQSIEIWPLIMDENNKMAAIGHENR